ncbi:MAG: hypothetical protein IPN79_11000 [Saprospiraceae bacterium]|nr:hypothetical protein [Saprospiraceae bacterium]
MNNRFYLFNAIFIFIFHAVPFLVWVTGNNVILFIAYIYLGLLYSIFSFKAYYHYKPKQKYEILVNSLVKVSTNHYNIAVMQDYRYNELVKKRDFHVERYEEASQILLKIQGVSAFLFALDFVREITFF